MQDPCDLICPDLPKARSSGNHIVVEPVPSATQNNRQRLSRNETGTRAELLDNELKSFPLRRAFSFGDRDQEGLAAAGFNPTQRPAVGPVMPLTATGAAENNL
jgi:hypothetical protein